MANDESPGNSDDSMRGLFAERVRLVRSARAESTDRGMEFNGEDGSNRSEIHASTAAFFADRDGIVDSDPTVRLVDEEPQQEGFLSRSLLQTVKPNDRAMIHRLVHIKDGFKVGDRYAFPISDRHYEYQVPDPKRPASRIKNEAGRTLTKFGSELDDYKKFVGRMRDFGILSTDSRVGEWESNKNGRVEHKLEISAGDMAKLIKIARELPNIPYVHVRRSKQL